MNEVDFLETRVRGLEREIRELRLTLWDEYAKASLTGLISYYGDVSHICDRDSRTSLHFAAGDHADQMLAEREKRTVDILL